MTMPYSVLTGFKRQIQEMDPLTGDWRSTKEVVGFQKPAFEMFCVPAQPNRPLQWYFSLYEFTFDSIFFFFGCKCMWIVYQDEAKTVLEIKIIVTVKFEFNSPWYTFFMLVELFGFLQLQPVHFSRMHSNLKLQILSPLILLYFSF